jgi:hypothetical protein
MIDIFQLYSHYGFKESHIALLFLTGFASSSTFGTFTGSKNNNNKKIPRKIAIKLKYLFVIS